MPDLNRVSRVHRTLQAPRLDDQKSPKEIIVMKKEPRYQKLFVSSLHVFKPRVLNSVLQVKNEQLLWEGVSRYSQKGQNSFLVSIQKASDGESVHTFDVGEIH